MFTTPAPSAPTVSASTVTTTSPSSPRPTGLPRGLSFLRNFTTSHNSLHPHPAGATGAREEPEARPASAQKSNGRPRASTTPPVSPIAAAASQSATTDSAASSRLLRTLTSPQADQHRLLSNPPEAATMTRTRADTAAPQLTVRNMSGPTPATSSASTPSAQPDGGPPKHLPSIRFIPHQDPRAARPSLQFPTITRTLPDESAVIRVGRYSERDNIPEVPSNVPSAAAVGFKSKVVSRKHCELWCKDGNWYIKDVKSSSGTFLNHIRLSQPNTESKQFRLKDGDIIQLGIDFRGGEEMIFRCVKIRIECNRGWQQALNSFNKQTHQRLRNLGKAKKEGDNASTHTSECAICLMSIAPCQSLFVAPCSHVWHFKCIRPILNGPTWPNFLCPNCRAVADLEADVEDPGDFEEWDEDAVQPNGESEIKDRHVTPKASTNGLNALPTSALQGGTQSDFTDLEAAISSISLREDISSTGRPTPDPTTPGRSTTPVTSSSVTQPVAINITGSNEQAGLSPLFQTARENLSPDRTQEGPMTPRNDAGPFVLDGSAGRAAGNRLRDTDSPSSGSTNPPTLPPLRMD